MIWFALAFPLLGAAFLLWKGGNRVVWWEVGLPLVVAALAIFGAKLAGQTAQTVDTEYWGGWAAEAIYDEEWNEKVSCSHPKYCTRTVTRTGTDGKSYSTTETYQCGWQHLYDVRRHPPSWRVNDSNGISIPVNQARFKELSNRWGGAKFRDLHRNYHTIDGDRYVATWDESTENLEPVVTKHKYENRVAVSDSIFNYPEVEERGGLYEYPGIRGYYRLPALLGKGGENRREGSRALDVLNAYLGRKKQVRVWVLLFPPGTPRQKALDQEALWKGGNKNELVICAGLRDNNGVAWAHVFSWTKREDLKVEVREWLESQEGPLDLLEFSHWLTPRVNGLWERTEFAEFSYLAVEPPLWSVILAFVLSAVATLGCCAWAWHNDFREWNS